MSHTTGKVCFKDGSVRWFEYNGTSDVCVSHLYETKKELFDNWRKDVSWNKCSCGKDEDVLIFSGYGSGAETPRDGRACKNCAAITKDPYYDW